MATAMLNAHAVVKRLQQAGFTEQQAEVLYEFVTENVASKDDLDRLHAATQTDLRQTEERLRHEITETAARLDRKIGQEVARLDHKIEQEVARLDHRIEQFRADTKADIAGVKAELIRWMVGVGILQTSLIAALLLKRAP